MPLKLFISYSHNDQAQLDELLEGLKPLEREGLVAPWTDRLIGIGENWHAKITTALGDCDLGLFLLSKRFFGSDFIDEKELRPLLERACSENVRLVPVLVGACDWTRTALGELSPLPDWNKYIENPGDDQPARDQAWLRVVTKIRQWATEFVDNSDTTLWEGSPYPGLRAFDECEAQIFTGRESDIEALVNKLEEGARFLAVYGASGSGKSSLVRAGLIPAWRRRFPAVDAMRVLLMKPDEDADGNPFTPLSAVLQPCLGPGSDRGELKQSLHNDPSSIEEHINTLLRGLPNSAELVLVVDQFEELFTTIDPLHRQPFAALLEGVFAHPRARIVITVRSDFFQCFEDYPKLSNWLNNGNGHFLIRSLGPEHYRTLIEAPARLAGFRFEQGLLDCLLADAKQGASREGLVPLLEFALAKLYEPFGERLANDEDLPHQARCFTKKAYQAFGGIKGAIGTAAKEAVTEVENAKDVLPHLFRELVSMSVDQKPTRRRAVRAELERDPVSADLIKCLVGDRSHARLLVAEDKYVEVAHETLFYAWQAMAEWITEFKHDLQLRDRMCFEAHQWDAGGRSDPHLLWSHERQAALYQSLQHLGQPLDTWKKEPEKSFLRPEAERLCHEITDPSTDHQRRDWIGARWAVIGDPRPGVGRNPETGLPHILWSDDVPGGEIELEGDAGRFKIEHPFQLSVQLVTRSQYMAFLEADDGYDDDAWWNGLTRPEPRWPPTGAGDNYPVGLVTWDEAVAYCRWLDHQFHQYEKIAPGKQIRLPTEWEWQWAATGGDRQQVYPWMGDWDATKLNSVDSGLMRTTASGLFPAGVAPCGALDMAGNVWEWCLNKYEKAEDITLGGTEERVLRGGSWLSHRGSCRAACRGRGIPLNRDSLIGFRLCLSSPIRNADYCSTEH
ncbi:MAG: SUMF1/EgtB/PvdO family nonheme iron enzyme [Gammaproteobacteria bacterium]|nr:SUMF1/EgtB/PvdO family nonheme iron enzyme [Gammaproteobacteria bacterium]